MPMEMTNPVSRGPQALILMLAWRCNASCVHCCWTALRDAGDHAEWKRDMTVGTVDAFLGLYGSSRPHVTLCGFGEPMTHPDYARIASAIASRTGVLSMTTNGSLLHEHPEILDVPGYLAVSLDSPDADIYEGIRRGLSFSRVIGNMRLAAGRRHPGRVLQVNMAVIRRNAHQIHATAALLRDVGFQRLQVLRGLSMDPSGNVINGDPLGQILSPSDPVVLEQMARVRADFPEIVVTDYFASRDGPYATPPGQHCGLPWTSMEVTTDGHAHPCCRSYETDLGPPAADPWRGGKMDRLRSQLESFAVDAAEFGPCSRCTMRGSRRA